LPDPLPRHPIFLAAAPERTPPEIFDIAAECLQCPVIGGHRMVGEETGDDLAQPHPLFGDGLVHAPSHLLLELGELRPHTVAPGFPFNLELALAGPAADEGKAQEGEGFRLAEPVPGRGVPPRIGQTR